MAYKWKPNKSARQEFAQKMNEIDEFCKQHNISKSSTSDSYYFLLNGKNYRISNHTIEASNSHAFNEFGEQKRAFYHDENDKIDICITAGKTRLIEIYNDLVAGYELDSRGFRKKDKNWYVY